MAAKKKAQTTQSYPRIEDENNPEHGLLNLEAVVELPNKLDEGRLRALIADAIANASTKASKEVLKVEPDMTAAQLSRVYRTAAKELFKYFKRSDPASVFEIVGGQNCREFAEYLLLKRARHQSTMQAGWLYQYLFLFCAEASGRFLGVSDVGTQDSDINLTINLKNSRSRVNLLVSMKNREDTISGGSQKGVTEKLEDLAKDNKNRVGPYCCVFALGMEKKARRKRSAHSVNTEIWPANVVWPFVSGYEYSEIMTIISEVKEDTQISPLDLPDEFLDEFEALCERARIVDENGDFSSKSALIDWLCT